MIDLVEIMKMFNLTEQPYVNLGCVWCSNGNSLYFYEDGNVYSSLQGELVGVEDGVVCIMNDVQQFLGMQPALFTETLEISYEKFEDIYWEKM